LGIELALKYGQPNFETLNLIMPKGLDFGTIGEIYGPETFSGRLNERKIKTYQGMWKGKLVMKRGCQRSPDAMKVPLNWDWDW